MSDKSDSNWKTKAAVATGAAVGSAAIAAALLWVKKRSDKANEQDQPAHPEDAPETD
ncbi:MAG: hypothetical protein KUG65_10400 [Sphingomonadaceae bacterium]|nr:hypothetical protein [Sphingomonadaceae bacterium]